MSQDITIHFAITITMPDGADVVVEYGQPRAAESGERFDFTEPDASDEAWAAVAPSAPAPVAAVPDPDRPKLGTTEQLILDTLADHHGRHSDPSGRATGQLIGMAACDSVPAAKQAIVRLDERGLIEREIRGKRCFRIALTPTGWSAARRTRPALDVGAIR